MSYFKYIKQDVVADSNNGSTSNLTGGGTFTGISTSTLGIVGIQVSLKTDQNCTVYVDQSPDGTNWDITDTYDYFHSLGGNGWTVQAVNSYVRLRVINLSTTTTTYFRLQLALCPMVEALPRSLSDDGRLKIEGHLSDGYDFHVENTPSSEMKVAQITLLAGTIFDGNILDSNFITSSVTNNGTVTQGNSQLLIRTNTTANGNAKAYTNRAARFVAGKAINLKTIIQLSDIGALDNKRRWGLAHGDSMPTIENGAYFELDSTTFSIVVMKGGVETRVSNGSFNGDYGEQYTLTTNASKYEIYLTANKIYFSVKGGILLHTVSGLTTTLMNTLSHYAYFDSVNSNGLDSDHIIYVRAVGVSRLGQLLNQPTSHYQSGTTAGVVFKYGPGNLHGVAISGVSNNSVITLYDNVASSGSVLWSSGSMSAQTIPFSLNLFGIPFSIGLTLVIASANSTVTVMYE